MGAGELVLILGSLVFTVLVVGGVLFGVLKMLGGMNKAAAEQQRLLREGIQASARLLSVQMGGMTMTVGVHRHLQLVLQLEVHPPGRPPYPAMLTTMVSELQVPQLQPGAQLTVRIDRMNPMKLALEAAGGAAPGMMPVHGGPGMPPPMAPGYPAPGMAPGYGHPGMAPGMVAFGAGPTVPAGAKVGLWIGIGGALLGVIVTVVVVLVNVVGVGLGDASEGDDVCAQAIRCCEVATAKTPESQKNCKNMGKLGVPKQVCVQTLESMRTMAESQGRHCK